jgi:hypothetical protein
LATKPVNIRQFYTNVTTKTLPFLPNIYTKTHRKHDKQGGGFTPKQAGGFADLTGRRLDFLLGFSQICQGDGSSLSPPQVGAKSLDLDIFWADFAKALIWLEK